MCVSKNCRFSHDPLKTTTPTKLILERLNQKQNIYAEHINNPVKRRVVRQRDDPVVRQRDDPVVRQRNDPVVRKINDRVVRKINDPVVRKINDPVVRKRNIDTFEQNPEMLRLEALASMHRARSENDSTDHITKRQKIQDRPPPSYESVIMWKNKPPPPYELAITWLNKLAPSMPKQVASMTEQDDHVPSMAEQDDHVPSMAQQDQHDHVPSMAEQYEHDISMAEQYEHDISMAEQYEHDISIAEQIPLMICPKSPPLRVLNI
jgi:hypothetical protein